MKTQAESPLATDALAAQPSMAPSWQPLLDGEAAERARRVSSEIASALSTDPGAMSSHSEAADRALFFAYSAQALDDHHHAELAGQFLDRAIDLLSSTRSRWHLYDGIAGVAWVAEHIAGGHEEPDAHDASSDLDESWRAHLRAEPGCGNYDLISGLAGQAVYALERLPATVAADGLAIIVDRLAAGAQVRDGGLTWLTAPEDLSPPTRAEHPDGYYNLGVAHGVPAVVAALAAARATGVRVAQAQLLYEGAVRWLLAQRLGPESPSTFPCWVRDGLVPRPARSAWCYGDPGAALTLFAAARLVDDRALMREALAIARRAAGRPVEYCGVTDAGLCHGAAGLAQLYNRFWQATGEPIFAAAARTWIDEVFGWQHPGSGVAGFEAFTPDEALLPKADSSFLTGAAGIGLTLLAAVTDLEPAWDRLLMASLAVE